MLDSNIGSNLKIDVIMNVYILKTVLYCSKNLNIRFINKGTILTWLIFQSSL